MRFLLFLHVFVVIVTFMIGGMLVLSETQLHRSSTVAEARTWLRLLNKLGPMIGGSAVLLLISGIAIMSKEHHDEHLSWNTSWVLVGLVMLVFLIANGPALIAPRAMALAKRADATPDGPMPADLRAALADPVVAVLGSVNPLTALGVVFLMTYQPGWTGSVLVELLFVAAGIALGTATLRQARAHASTG